MKYFLVLENIKVSNESRGPSLWIRASSIVFAVLFTFSLLSHAFAENSKQDYRVAIREFNALKNSKMKRKNRKNWISCIRKFEKVYTNYPESSRADNAMYMAGRVYQDLYGYSNKSSDLDMAIQAYRGVVKRYPDSKVADDAQFNIGECYEKYKKDKTRAYLEYAKVVSLFPKKTNTEKNAREKLEKLRSYKPKAPSKKASVPSTGNPVLGTEASVPSTENPVLVTGIRHWSNPNYSRVVIDVGKEVSYSSRLLKEDTSINKPSRLYIDLFNARTDPKVLQPIPIYDGLLKRARAGQYTKDTVRVVLDIESIKSYSVFPLEGPFRIVVDVRGEGKPSNGQSITSQEGKPLSLSRQLGLCVGKIVIDPGHGGHDPGAIGPTGLKEKDVVLKLAQKLQKMIKENLKCEAVLTRKDDTFIPLEERTAIATTQKADLFISIHANASPNKHAYGIETYILNFASDDEAAKVAARENATSTKNISDLQGILRKIIMDSKIHESRQLAEHVQGSMTTKLTSHYSHVKNLGVKQAPFYVLIGAQMPSVLVEVSFISNTREEKRLDSEEYLDRLAFSIFSGVRQYIDGIALASF